MRTSPPTFRTFMLDGDIAGIVPATMAPWSSSPDLIWTPPGSKSGPDLVGSVVEVQPLTAPDVWVRAQLDKRNRYLEHIRAMIRAKVEAGLLVLTPELERLLGTAPVVGAVSLRPPGAPSLPDPGRLLASPVKHWVG